MGGGCRIKGTEGGCVSLGSPQGKRAIASPFGVPQLVPIPMTCGTQTPASVYTIWEGPKFLKNNMTDSRQHTMLFVI